ncbi:MAG: sulfotransferase, partial [Pseudomonadota bacterium]
LAPRAKRKVQARPRAHGDGLHIHLDSPEAFEEVLWKMYWPEKYRGNLIALWRAADQQSVANRFIQRHMQKISAARATVDCDTPRYCSKNNANIARLSYLGEAFPDCRVVIALRQPRSHAASLLRQHHNFRVKQAEDEFVRRYMRDIGHFEFGLLHQPVAFAGFDHQRYDALTPDYWLAYWIGAFGEVAAHRDRCLIVTQDALRAEPGRTMHALCEALALAPGDATFEHFFHPQPDAPPSEHFDPALLREADELYATLAADALGSS